MQTYRIKDIATLAGVSTGTVDRILHKRGRVSAEAQEKVDEILKEINYQPNLIARSLALKKKYNFIILTPQPVKGEYWGKLAEGVDKAEQELACYNISVQRFYFDQYDEQSFDAAVSLVTQTDCQGVIVATLFRDSVVKLGTHLDTIHVPYVLIDAYVENTHCVAYYGTHSYDSGYIAGRLLFEQIQIDSDVVVFYFNRKGSHHSTQVARREEGFYDYFRHRHHRGHIYTLQMRAEENSDNDAVLTAFFKANPQVKAGIIFNSRAYLVGKYLEKWNRAKDFKLIGYDVLDDNIHFLQNGLITHLIAQRPEVQGLNAVKVLFRHLIMKEEVEQVNYMPIDILTKENIVYYNNYI
ncbi:MAG: LacI family DNA-binding transcriptional regulator [Tannerellaceae bacterium]|jgi:LacI family transcriptional regulator|nr:LacI family DNA-binding transcriptional regulator [Tannerellaceae bacterium]